MSSALVSNMADEDSEGGVPFSNAPAAKPSSDDNSYTHSRNPTNDKAEHTAASSLVLDDGSDEEETGASPSRDDNNGSTTPQVVTQSDSDAIALFLNADITSQDGTTLQTVQLDCDGVRKVLQSVGGYGDSVVPSNVTIRRVEQMRPRPMRRFSSFMNRNQPLQNESARVQLKGAVNRAQSGRFNKRQRVEANIEQPPPKVNNPFDKQRSNNRSTLMMNLRKFRKVKSKYSLGSPPFNLLLDSYTTAHAVTHEHYNKINAKMDQYPKQILRADYRPVVVAEPVRFQGPGIRAMGMLRSKTWMKLNSVDVDERHILSFVTPENGDVNGGYEHIDFFPFSAAKGVVPLLKGFDLDVNDTLNGVMSFHGLPIDIKLLAPGYKWMNVEVQLQSQPGARVSIRDLNDDELRRQLMNGYNSKLMNTLYGAASVMREFHGDFVTDIDLNGVCALLCIPPLSDDAFVLDMSQSVVTDKLIQDTAAWDYSLYHKLVDNHFTHPVNVFPYDYDNKIEKLCKALFITSDNVVLDRYMDPNRGDCDKHVRRAVFQNTNKFILIGVDPDDTLGFSHEIRLMVHSNKISTTAGLINIVEAASQNFNFVAKSVMYYCSWHRTIGPDCGGFKCIEFEKKKAIHARVIAATYCNKSVDQKAMLQELHNLKYCPRCGDTYTDKNGRIEYETNAMVRRLSFLPPALQHIHPKSCLRKM